MDMSSYNYTELELAPYMGSMEPYERAEEGEFKEIPSGEPGWIPPEPEPEPEVEDPEESITEDKASSRLRQEREKKAAQLLRERGEFEEAYKKAQLEELKARRREYKGKYRTGPGKAIGRAWRTAKEIAGPKTPIKGLYIPKAMPGLYVPKVPAWRPTTEFMPAGEAHKPHLGTLRRAGSPPPMAPVKVPFRGIERFEGIGTALGRLRLLEKFPKVDQAVYQEIHANGDIDVPSHVKKEVKQLGFSHKEIDSSLKRLRDIGLIVPTGNKLDGEKELMVAGG